METFAVRDDSRTLEATGTVLAVADDAISVWTGDGMVDAKRAVSCLVAPEEGDHVLLVGLAENPYVLAVLERPAGNAVRIASTGDLTLELRAGRFTVSAAKGIDIASSEVVSLAADRIEGRAREGKLFLGSAKFVAGAVDAVLERLYLSVKRAFRRVEEIDHMRAGQIDHAADGMARLHGEHTLVTARELVKADAKQIHFG